MSASREKRLRRELREAEANSDTVKKVKKKKKQRTQLQKKKLRNAVGAAVAIVLVLVFALLIFVNSGVLQRGATAMTVGPDSLSPLMVDYYYQDNYNTLKSTYTNYGAWSYMVDTTRSVEDQIYGVDSEDQTWSDYIMSRATEEARQAYALYDAAMADGYTLDEETQATVDGLPATIRDYATQAGYKDVDEYLEASYGKGATLDDYIQYVTIRETAEGYSSATNDSFAYTDDELRKYYEENKRDLSTVTYHVFETEDKETADAMAAELDGTEETFDAEAYEFAADESAVGTSTLRQDYGYSGIDTAYADWLFAGSRIEGESQVFATDNGYAVVMFVSREDNDYRAVNVRHILVQVESTGEEETTDDDGNPSTQTYSTDEDWENCETAINDILAEWEDSDMTEETFAELAKEYSDDTTAEDGGLIEDISKGDMVQSFEEWCFEDHEPGDYGVVQSPYGYHLIYFVGYGEERWISLAENSKRQADYDAWYDALVDGYDAEEHSFGMLFVNKKLAP